MSGNPMHPDEAEAEPESRPSTTQEKEASQTVPGTDGISPSTWEAVSRAARLQGMTDAQFAETILSRAARDILAAATPAMSSASKDETAEIFPDSDTAAKTVALTRVRQRFTWAGSKGLQLMIERVVSSVRDSLMQPANAHPLRRASAVAPPASAVPPAEEKNRLRLTQAFMLIDEANRGDPHMIWVDGRPMPKELHYGREMTRWLKELYPRASETLQLAARAQHIRRFTVPRASYPDGRAGYLAWRNVLKKFHAEEAAKILSQADYDPSTIARVQELILKKGLKQDEEVQQLENVICVVFLMYELEDFAAKHPPEKINDILRKTFAKMSDEGREALARLPLPAVSRNLVEALLDAELSTHP